MTPGKRSRGKGQHEEELTGVQVARLYDCSLNTIYGLVESGQLHRIRVNPIKKNNPLLFSKKEVYDLARAKGMALNEEEEAEDHLLRGA